MSVKYDAASRAERGRENAEYLSQFIDLRGKRVLEIGPALADTTVALVENYDCEVVGIDPMRHPNWSDVQNRYPKIKLIQGDSSSPPSELKDESFDFIFSFVVWEHIRHPWSALQQCQRLLKTNGKKFIRANLYRSSIASHLYNHIKEPWPHLMYSPDEISRRFNRPDLGWAFWVNKLTYQQYLFYFRELGFFITHERFMQTHFKEKYYIENENRLGLYPKWDLKTDFFEVLLEFDSERPKQPVVDPVYRNKKHQ